MFRPQELLPPFFSFTSLIERFMVGPLFTIYATGTGMKFALGCLVATLGALRVIERAGDNPATFLLRHLSGDWGDLGAEDAHENELSLREGFRLLSAYRLTDGTKIWIITEADRSATTVLLPEEY